MSIEGTESVHWQIKSEDKEWIMNISKETGFGISEIIHQLILSFEEEG